MLDVVRVAVTRPADVARAVREAVGAQLVVLTRGGGEGVHVLDDDELIAVVAASPVPVAAALGHASDDLVLGRVADACFPTPTAFGAWLRSVVEEKRTRRQKLQESEQLLQSQVILDQLRGLQVSVSRWRLVGLVALAVLVGVALWHALRPS